MALCNQSLLATSGSIQRLGGMNVAAYPWHICSSPLPLHRDWESGLMESRESRAPLGRFCSFYGPALRQDSDISKLPLHPRDLNILLRICGWGCTWHIRIIKSCVCWFVLDLCIYFMLHPLKNFFYWLLCVCMCVCVCVRERERERERDGLVVPLKCMHSLVDFCIGLHPNWAWTFNLGTSGQSSHQLSYLTRAASSFFHFFYLRASLWSQTTHFSLQLTYSTQRNRTPAYNWTVPRHLGSVCKGNFLFTPVLAAISLSLAGYDPNPGRVCQSGSSQVIETTKWFKQGKYSTKNY